MTSKAHIIRLLREYIRLGERARELLARIEAEDTPANDAAPPPPKPPGWARDEVVRRLRKAGIRR